MNSAHDDSLRRPPAESDSNVNARNRADAAVAQARLAAIVTGSEDAIVAKTLQGIITAWNPAAERLFGYTPDDVIGRSVLTIIPPDLHHEEPEILAKISRGERITHYDTVRMRKDGSRFPASLTISPVRDDMGRIIGASKILRDISERKALEAERALYLDQLQQQAVELEASNEQLQTQAVELELQNQELTSTAEALEEAAEITESLRAEAERANAAKSQFLATMSHELRTPINAIVGYAQLLELGVPDPVTPTQQQQLGRISGSAQHLLGLVNDVLDGAKLDFGQMHVAHEPAITGGAISAALMLVGPQAEQHGIRLADGRSDEAGVPYVGDDARVRQILVNLLSNAIKFTPAGGTVTVTSGTASAGGPGPAPGTMWTGVRVASAGPWAYIEIEDTGVGIPAEQQAAVFEPFVQAAHSRSPYTRSTGGTGLGLTISRRLARLMGGALTLESVPGQGSKFTLWLRTDASVGSLSGISAHGSADDTGSLGAQSGPQAESPLQQPAADRSWHVDGLADVGRALREESDTILATYVLALRNDPSTPVAHTMPQAQLENHAITLVADLAQSLVIVAQAGETAAALMRDGTAILRTISESHGARRFAQGWTEAALRRDYDLLRDVIERAVRAGVMPQAGDVSAALHMLERLMERAQSQGLAAYRHAGGTAPTSDGPSRDGHSVM